MNTYRRMLYEPKMNPIVRPTPVPIMAPILTGIERCCTLQAGLTYFTVGWIHVQFTER